MNEIERLRGLVEEAVRTRDRAIARRGIAMETVRVLDAQIDHWKIEINRLEGKED